MRLNSLIISLLCPVFLFAQKMERTAPSLFELRKSLEPSFFRADFLTQKTGVFSTQKFDAAAFSILKTEKPTSILSKKFCADDLAFFCRIEHRFAKKSATAVKFRLGSVEYVDFLEGKN